MRIKEPQGEPIKVYFEGKELEVYAGEPIAIGLLDRGIYRLSNSTDGRKRGAFHIGPAPVNVDGRKRVDSRSEPLKQGMRISRGSYKEIDLSVPEEEYRRTLKFYEVLVIGGGPAGIAAAIEASKYANVALVEREGFLGGYARLREYEELRERIKKLEASEAEVYLKTTALGIYDKGEYLLVPAYRENELIEFYAKRVILATGAIDRILLYENNDLPGTFRAYRALKAISVYGVSPGERVAILGQDPDLVRPLLEKYGIEYVHVKEPVRVIGDEKIEAVEDSSGERYEVDAVVVSDGRNPDINPITQPGGRIKYEHGYLRPVVDEHYRIVKDVYVAGSALGVMDHRESFESGRAVATHVLLSLGYLDEAKDFKPSYRSYENKPIKFDRYDLSKVYLCGCGATLKSVYELVKQGVRELQIIKRLTHLAMGFCQGRYCLFNAARVVSQLTGKSINELDIPVARPPIYNVKMGIVARR